MDMPKWLGCIMLMASAGAAVFCLLAYRKKSLRPMVEKFSLY